MRPMPLRERIPAALALQPMTLRMLGRVLAVHSWSAARAALELRTAGKLQIVGTQRRGNGRPAKLWGLA